MARREHASLSEWLSSRSMIVCSGIKLKSILFKYIQIILELGGYQTSVCTKESLIIKMQITELICARVEFESFPLKCIVNIFLKFFALKGDTSLNKRFLIYGAPNPS